MKIYSIIRRIILLSNIIFIASCFVSCEKENPTEAIDAAETALANNDFESTRKICHRVISVDSMKNLSVRDLCRLSLLFMELYDTPESNTDENGDIGVAARCFHRAMVVNSDSVYEYLSLLPIDKLSLLYTVNTLNHSMVAPSDFFIQEEPTDSVYDFEAISH